jgi:hypothetical protein
MTYLRMKYSDRLVERIVGLIETDMYTDRIGNLQCRGYLR